MKPFSSLKVALALTASVHTLLAEPDRTQKPQPGPAPAASFPHYQLRELSNGLKVFVIEDDRKPTITLRLLIKSGSTSDAGKTGLAGFTAGLLNRGTSTLTAAQFAAETDFIGMRLEAMAGPDSIAVSAGGLTKYTEKILALFSDAVLHPAFPEDQFAKEQRKTLSALAAEKQEPARLASKLAGKVIFGEHPYGAFMTPATVQAVTREDLVGFHRRHFLPNNATLAVVGDVSAADILPRIEKALAAWKPGALPELELPPAPSLKGITVHLVDRPGSVQSNIRVCQTGPARRDPNVPELNVLNATLGGGFSGRLFQNLREKHGWTYGAYSAFDMRKHAGAFEATAETRNDVTAKAIEETLKEIARLRDEPVPEPELELQRQYNIGNYLLSLENTGRTAQRVQDIDLYGLPPDFYKTYARRMEAVTAASTQELARKFLSTENVAITVVGEAKEVLPELEKIGKVHVYDTELQPIKK